jgi:hypothetical protein
LYARHKSMYLPKKRRLPARRGTISNARVLI